MNFTIKPTGTNIFQLTNYSEKLKVSCHYYLIVREQVTLYGICSYHDYIHLCKVIKEIIGSQPLDTLVIPSFDCQKANVVPKFLEDFPDLKICASEKTCNYLIQQGHLGDFYSVPLKADQWIIFQDFYLLFYRKDSSVVITIYDKITRSLISSYFGSQNENMLETNHFDVIEKAVDYTLRSIVPRRNLEEFLTNLNNSPEISQLLPLYGCVISMNNVRLYLNKLYSCLYVDRNLVTQE